MSLRNWAAAITGLLSLVMVANAAELNGPQRCSWLGETYGVGDVIIVVDKVFQCETVYADNMKALYYWIRLVEQEQRLKRLRAMSQR